MIKLPKEVLTKIHKHSRRVYPEECCGFLLGQVNDGHKLVSEIQTASNARTEERRRRFLITADEYRQVEAGSRGKQLEVVGFYHSHPDQKARPSAYDLEYAWPWFSYLIVSVEQREPKEVSSWVVDDDRRNFSEEQILIV